MIILVMKVLSCCYHVASLSGRTPLPQIITALRTVLLISHPFGVIVVLPILWGNKYIYVRHFYEGIPCQGSPKEPKKWELKERLPRSQYKLKIEKSVSRGTITNWKVKSEKWFRRGTNTKWKVEIEKSVRREDEEPSKPPRHRKITVLSRMFLLFDKTLWLSPCS